MAMSHLRRRLATGTNATVVAVLVAVIVVIVVDLAGANRVRWDLSTTGDSTLQPETLATMAAVDERGAAVRITAFSAKQVGRDGWFKDRTVKDFLREIEHRSDGITTRFVNFDADRMTAEALGVDRYGTIVVEGEGDRVDITERQVFKRGPEKAFTFLGEGAIMAAITQVLADESRTLYGLVGHGERALFDRGQGELKELARLGEKQGWTLKPLNLLEMGAPVSVPGDASAVLVIGPRAPLTPPEAQALASYLGDGGRIGWFVDPGGHVPTFIETHGVSVPSGVVLDQVAVFPHEDRPLLRYRRHPITEDLLVDNTPTVAAHAAPVVTGAADGVRASPLLVTSRRGWVERGDERPSMFTEGQDVAGPVTVAAALQLSPPATRASARLLVIGDADLVTDELLTEAPGNATFAVNSLRWLLGADDEMSRVGRPGTVRKLTLSRDQLAMIRWLVIGGLPLIALLLGVAVRLVRR